MANTKTTEKSEEIKSTEESTEIKNLRSQIDKLEGMLNGMMSSSSQPTIIDTTSKMDMPCTLIHLIECMDDLPTVIKVNNTNHYFTKFGESRTFRFQDMQNIVAQYRSFFDRGIFGLGDDCSSRVDELGIKNFGVQIPVSIYNKIESVSKEEFESFIKKINEMQRVQLAKTWIQRYLNNEKGYKDISKIKILNKYTKDKAVFKNGLLSDLLDEVLKEDDE